MACSYMYEYDIPCVRTGDTMQAIAFTVTLNSVALDLTGAVIVLYLNSGDSLTTVDSGGLTITDAAAGVFTIDKQRITFPAKNYQHKIVFTLQNSDVKTYIYGTWEITK